MYTKEIGLILLALGFGAALPVVGRSHLLSQKNESSKPEENKTFPEALPEEIQLGEIHNNSWPGVSYLNKTDEQLTKESVNSKGQGDPVSGDDTEFEDLAEMNEIEVDGGEDKFFSKFGDNYDQDYYAGEEVTDKFEAGSLDEEKEEDEKDLEEYFYPYSDSYYYDDMSFDKF